MLNIEPAPLRQDALDDVPEPWRVNEWMYDRRPDPRPIVEQWPLTMCAELPFDNSPYVPLTPGRRRPWA